MKNTKLFDLGWRDFINGLIMAVLVPCVAIVQQSLDAGVLVFNWRTIGLAAISGAVGYLIKNFFTGNASKEDEPIGGGGVPNPPKPKP